MKEAEVCHSQSHPDHTETELKTAEKGFLLKLRRVSIFIQPTPNLQFSQTSYRKQKSC